MSLRSPLAQARGLGSAKSGVGHWWGQRLSAIALLPLTLWFVYGLISHSSAGHQAVLTWISTPSVALALMLFLGALFYHSQLGVQVVIEDYVHAEGVKIVSLVLSRFLHIVLAAASIFAVLLIAFGARS